MSAGGIELFWSFASGVIVSGLLISIWAAHFWRRRG